MNKCKSCRHWTATPEDEYNEICNPYDPDTLEPMEIKFKVNECKNPKLLRFERPIESNGFSITDGSRFAAHLYVAEEFGCILHEEFSSHF